MSPVCESRVQTPRTGAAYNHRLQRRRPSPAYVRGVRAPQTSTAYRGPRTSTAYGPRVRASRTEHGVRGRGASTAYRGPRTERGVPGTAYRVIRHAIGSYSSTDTTRVQSEQSDSHQT